MAARAPTLVALLVALLALACSDTSSTDADRGDQPAAAAARPAGERPLDVILVSIDTLRRDHVGFHGYERNTTPFLDQLAEKSIVFENAYTTFSWTLVAHMSLLTGLYPSQHGVWKEDASLPPSVPTLAERLQARGYHTMGFHDSQWLGPRYGFDRGFDVYERHSGAAMAGLHLERAMAKRPKTQPFFMFLHLMDVHNAPFEPGNLLYEPPEPFDTLFDPDARAKLEGVDSEALWHGSETVTPEQHEAIVALYDGGIRYADTKLGEWIELWWKAGLLDHAVLVVTSDHGECLDQRDRGYGGHGFAFQEGLRVPLIVHLPGDLRAGERVSRPVSLVDVLPTVLEGVGSPVDPRLPGYSLMGAGRQREDMLYAEQPDRMEALYLWPWKVLRPTVGKDPQLRVFHLENDPDEQRPLTRDDVDSQFARVTAELLQRAATERGSWYVPDEPNPDAGPMSEEDAAALRALGYLGGRDN